VICKHLEAGQGVWTGLPAIVAEELDASWEQMRVESAPARVPMYGNLAMGGKVQLTGGSTAGGQLLAAAARGGRHGARHAGGRSRQGVGCAGGSDQGERGSGVTRRRGPQATFGELAGLAAKEPVPTQVTLKDPGTFKIIGREKLPRLDARAKSTGKQQFAIDVMLPGMMTAVVMRPPRFGAKVISFDASKARPSRAWSTWCRYRAAWAVVGRDMWSARKGREALSVTGTSQAPRTRHGRAHEAVPGARARQGGR